MLTGPYLKHRWGRSSAIRISRTWASILSRSQKTSSLTSCTTRWLSRCSAWSNRERKSRSRKQKPYTRAISISLMPTRCRSRPEMVACSPLPNLPQARPLCQLGSRKIASEVKRTCREWKNFSDRTRSFRISSGSSRKTRNLKPKVNRVARSSEST